MLPTEKSLQHCFSSFLKCEKLPSSSGKTAAAATYGSLWEQLCSQRIPAFLLCLFLRLLGATKQQLFPDFVTTKRELIGSGIHGIHKTLFAGGLRDFRVTIQVIQRLRKVFLLQHYRHIDTEEHHIYKPGTRLITTNWFAWFYS